MQTATVSLVPGSAAWNRLYTSTKVVDLVQGRALKVWNQWFGIAPPFEGTNRTAWGTLLEPVIIQAAAEENNWRVTFPGTVIDPDDAMLATTADFVANEEIAGDAKNRADDQAHKYQVGEATEAETIQVQWHAGILRLPKCAIAVLIGGNDLRVFPSDADPDLFLGMKEIVARFHRDHIVTERPPPMDASDAASDYLRAMFPRDTAPIIQADESLSHLVAAYHHASRAFDAAEEAKSIAGNLLRQAIGDAAGVRGEGFSVSYKASKERIATNWEALVKDLPSVPADLLAKHTTTKPGPRSLRVQWKGTP